MLTRRQLLKTGVAGAALLGVARLGYGPMRPDAVFNAGTQATFQILDANGKTVLAAIARAMLQGALPADAQAREQALQTAVYGCDVAIAGLPVLVQDEVKQLLVLLSNRITRRWVVGVLSPWQTASEAEVAAFLTRWRYSSFQLMRSGYQALHQIVFAAWYGNADHWSAIGYEGPPEFMKDFWHA